MTDMLTDRPASTAGERRETFDSLNPRNGDVVATYPVHTEADVREAVARAREAAAWWAGLGWDGRRQVLDQWKGVITRRIAQLAEYEATGDIAGRAVDSTAKSR